MHTEWQQRIGVGQRQHHYGRHVGTTNTTPVVSDDGPLQGLQVGEQTEHWSGRVDAKVTAATLSVNPNIRPERHPRKAGTE